MPDNKKEQEREELHRAIWAIADDLRGAWTAGISNPTFWASCSTAIFPRT